MPGLGGIVGDVQQAYNEQQGGSAIDQASAGLQEIIDMLRPEAEARQRALASYEDILSGKTDITRQQGYQAGLQTGQQALESSAAAKGMQLSGLNIENLAGFGTQYYQQQRNQALNELAGLAGMGGVGQQAMLGAMGEKASLPMQQYQMQLAAQQGQQAGFAGMLGGLGSLGMGIASLAKLSDTRTKHKLAYVDTEQGYDLYEFEYKPEFKPVAGNGRYIGVLAQDVLEINPEAVVFGWDGYYMVDYSKLPVQMVEV